MHRASFPNPDRPLRWPGEEGHYRSEFQIGDVVRVERSVARIVAFNNTWSAPRGGRLVHLEPVGPSYGISCAWEAKIEQLAEEGDVGSHPCHRDWGWRHVPASWLGGSDARDGCEVCRTRILVESLADRLSA